MDRNPTCLPQAKNSFHKKWMSLPPPLLLWCYSSHTLCYQNWHKIICDLNSFVFCWLLSVIFKTPLLFSVVCWDCQSHCPFPTWPRERPVTNWANDTCFFFRNVNLELSWMKKGRKKLELIHPVGLALLPEEIVSELLIFDKLHKVGLLSILSIFESFLISFL